MFGLYSYLREPLDGQLNCLSIPNECATKSLTGPGGTKGFLAWAKNPNQQPGAGVRASGHLLQLRYHQPL